MAQITKDLSHEEFNVKTDSSINHLSRRQFLRGAGTVALTLGSGALATRGIRAESMESLEPGEDGNADARTSSPKVGHGTERYELADMRGVSMLTRSRGYNAAHAAQKTNRRERGRFYYPDDLYVVRDNAATEQTYEEWCADLAAQGVNWLRIKFTGDNERNASKGFRATALEPPPYGTFNIWHSDLDPGNLDRYRADQVANPVPSDLWERSNLGQLIAAAERHEIKFDVIPFESSEFRDGWRYHAWNRDNEYVNGQQCESQDRGFLAHAYEVFTDSQAIDAAQARLQFLIDCFAGHDVVACWELCAEMTWLATDEQWWGLSDWGNGMRANILDKMVPWVDKMALYIKERHPAPVGNGQMFLGSLDSFPVNSDHQMNVINEIHAVPSLDLVFINWYYGDNPEQCKQRLRAAQGHFPGKQILVEQYAPYELKRTSLWQESAPFLPSKGHQWVLACGEYGVNGPLRWPGLRERGKNVWSTGGYADPGMQEIAGVTRKLAEDFGASTWASRGESYDDRVSGMPFVSAWGDGRHVAAYLRGSNQEAQVQVNGLEAGTYAVTLYDWATGERLGTQTRSAPGLSFRSQPVEGAIALYVTPTDDKPPESPDTPTLISPADETVTGSSQVEFRWSDTGAVRYNLRVDGAVHEIEATSMTLELSDGAHSWAVQAVEASGKSSDFSDPWTVTVETTTPPPTPDLESPADGTVTDLASVEFHWSDVGAAAYHLRVDENVYTTEATSMTLTLSNGSHAWRVRAVDADGRAGSYTEPWTVVVETTPVQTLVRLMIRDETSGEEMTFPLKLDHAYTLKVSNDS